MSLTSATAPPARPKLAIDWRIFVRFCSAADNQTTSDITPQAEGLVGGGRDFVWRLHVVGSPDPDWAGTVLGLGQQAQVVGRHGAHLPVADSLLSRQHLQLLADSEGVTVTDLGSRNGTFVAGRRVDRARLSHGGVLRFGNTVAVLEADSGTALDFAAPSPEVPGLTERARQLRRDLHAAAQQQQHLLLLGETGTGKEHAAAAFALHTGRKGPLVRLNIAAVPAELFEAELFGHVAGAFTGAAAARPGRLREADRGVLVLDEIGELAPALQPKLLRVLEEPTIRPVGASRDVAVDVRIVASTNADLDALVARGKFRADLLARLCYCEVRLPTLRERRADLLHLADAVQPVQVRGRTVPWRTRITPEALEALLLSDWPHNLRSLRGVLARAHTSAGRETIRLAHLPAEVLDAYALRLSAPPPATAGGRPAATDLRATLAHHGGSVDLTARHYGVHRRQVYRWLEYLGISLDEVETLRRAARSGG